jgi:hypothetical protein
MVRAVGHEHDKRTSGALFEQHLDATPRIHNTAA